VRSLVGLVLTGFEVEVVAAVAAVVGAAQNDMIAVDLFYFSCLPSFSGGGAGLWRSRNLHFVDTVKNLHTRTTSGSS